MNQPRRAAAEDALYKKVTLRVMPFLFVAYMVSCLFGLGMGMLLGGNGLFLAVGNLEKTGAQSARVAPFAEA